MHRFRLSSLAAVAFVLVMTFGSGASGFFVDLAAAQPPPPPDPDNTTNEASGTVVQIQVEALQTFARLDENQAAFYDIEVRDVSLPGAHFYAPAIQLSCAAVNETRDQVRSWAYSFTPPSILVRGATITFQVVIAAGIKPFPEYYQVDFECRAGPPVNDVIGRFTLRAQATEYVYMAVSSANLLDYVGPDEPVTFQVEIQNSGSHPKRYDGRVVAPPGWDFPSPPSIIILPGESEVVSVTGISPRDQLVYISSSQSVVIYYHPEGYPGKEQSAFFPLTMKGLYLHPALLPVVLLAIALFAVLAFLIVLARRAIEEQILGKPVPPWRIPVEREYLQRLSKTDPDQFYVVRYYLMVEEHQSALLWFYAYKAATKKDRKREHGWMRTKRKHEREITRLERKHARFEASWDRYVARQARRHENEFIGLERTLRRGERKGFRKADRKHTKRVRRLEKRHRKRVRKATRKHAKREAKAVKRSARENKRRARRGEDIVPFMATPAPELPVPDLPPPPQKVQAPLEASRYAKRAQRMKARQARRAEQLASKRAASVDRHRLRTDRRIDRVRAKTPPEPVTHLYAHDEYIPQDEAIVEDDRGFLARLLHVPTLEEREAEQRRRAVYAAKLDEAKKSGDGERVESVKRSFADERAQRVAQRREQEARVREHDQEAKRLLAERRRAAKRDSAGSKATEAEVAGPEAPAGQLPGQARGVRARLSNVSKRKADERETDLATAAEPPAADAKR